MLGVRTADRYGNSCLNFTKLCFITLHRLFCESISDKEERRNLEGGL